MIYDLIAGLDSPVVPQLTTTTEQEPAEQDKSKLSTEQRLLDIIECLIEIKLPEANSQQTAPVPQYYSFMLDDL